MFHMDVTVNGLSIYNPRPDPENTDAWDSLFACADK